MFPRGWDKTYCLRYLEEFQEIHFFGDKTYKVHIQYSSHFTTLNQYVWMSETSSSILQGGNDHEIYESQRTVGHTGQPHTHKNVDKFIICFFILFSKNFSNQPGWYSWKMHCSVLKQVDLRAVNACVILSYDIVMNSGLHWIANFTYESVRGHIHPHFYPTFVTIWLLSDTQGPVEVHVMHRFWSSID